MLDDSFAAKATPAGKRRLTDAKAANPRTDHLLFFIIFSMSGHLVKGPAELLHTKQATRVVDLMRMI
jgi:hypothetical protein